MDNNIRALLDELYADTPALRQRETELIALITELRATKPTQPIDAKFKAQLRAAVVMKAVVPKTAPTPWFRMLAWTAPAAAIAVFAVVTVQNLPSQKSITTTGTKVVITDVEREAFGNLAESDLQSATTRPAASGGEVTTIVDDKLTSAPDPNFQVTVFSAPDGWTIPQLPVLQRSMSLGNGLSNLVGGLKLDLLSVGALKNVQLDYLTFSERAADGYSVTIDRPSGQLSMSKKYGSSAELKETTLQRDAVVQPDQALPKDEILFEAANAFLKKYGIATADLAAPEIRKDWLAYQSNESLRYTPSQVTVVYPWVIKGTPVVDESGWAYGLNVTVNVSDLVITSVTNIVPLRFNSSAYEVVANREELLPAIRRGGNSYSTGIPAPDVVTVALEQPTPVYLLYRSYRETNAVEYLAPALKFPIPVTAITSTGRPAVVVPVVKDLFGAGTDAGGVSAPASPAIDLPIAD